MRSTNLGKLMPVYFPTSACTFIELIIKLKLQCDYLFFFFTGVIRMDSINKFQILFTAKSKLFCGLLDLTVYPEFTLIK